MAAASPTDRFRTGQGGTQVKEPSEDPRSQSQRDRDRILYTLAFRRLAGVTQVVSATEGHIFHNRLTHTLEVAQIARRLAEYHRENCLKIDASRAPDPDVAEASALAHDLGHPPFGHVAEHELDRLVKLAGNPDGFEGNAQSFRIVTKLAAHNADYLGINLTRATLNGILKYPWLRDVDDPSSKAHHKFGAYRTEEEELWFARSDDKADRRRSIEADMMNTADDIAYSGHDLDDFYRAGLIPLEHLVLNNDEFEAFITEWKKDLDERPDPRVTSEAINDHLDLFLSSIDLFRPRQAYRGIFNQRAGLRERTSALIQEFILSVGVENHEGRARLTVQPEQQLRMRFLQRLVWYYVIDNPRLGTLQRGQRNIIKMLYRTYLRGVRQRDVSTVPPTFHEELESLGSASKPGNSPSVRESRLAADIVASFTDYQAGLMFRRITGAIPGSIADLPDA